MQTCCVRCVCNRIISHFVGTIDEVIVAVAHRDAGEKRQKFAGAQSPFPCPCVPLLLNPD